MVKVSIIMPVYNSERYLRKAIESVLNQDFQDFELILIDDGSPDNSGKICDEYADLNANVKVIHKKNGGICSARNAGIEASEGEYIGFCDNDDEYLPGLISDNYILAKKYDVDLMRYAKIKRLEKSDGRVWESVSKLKNMFITRNEFYQYFDNIRREDTVWTALYKKSIIDEYHIRFDETIHYGSEDLNFNLRFLRHCEKLGFNSKAYYLWTQRESHSTSRKFRRDFLEKSMINMDLEYEFYNEKCKKKVNNTMKNEFLINSYVYPIIDYMCIKACDMSLEEKANYLERMRNHEIFDKSISKNTLENVKRKNYRTYITMKLFYEKKYKRLIFLIDKGTSILAHFRFKK